MDNKEKLDHYIGVIREFIRAKRAENQDLVELVEEEKIIETVNTLEPVLEPKDGFTDEERNYIIFHVGNFFTLKMTDEQIVVSKDVDRWLDANKSDINWNYWKAYEDYLISQGREQIVIEKNEAVIDSILDLSGNPKRDEASWKIRGLVMGNVQSGKTQNYIGLINKAMDCGYKVIILLGGGNSNDLRVQTQVRVDEGVIGKRSKHLMNQALGNNNDFGVGKFRDPSLIVNTLTSTENDFSKAAANAQGINLNDVNSPVIFTIKKNTNILKNLEEWIRTFHDQVDLENDKRLDLPMLLLDDEADYATPNSRDTYEQVTRTNELIRKILNLFNKSTYVGYTATPFANIFIHPDSKNESLGDDLYPDNFMIRIPVPDAYLGQNFYFENQDLEKIGPIEIIDDNEEMLPMTGQKTDTPVGPISPSLKEAVRAFVISCSIRDNRGQKNDHKSMIINITHLNALQQGITTQIEDYLREIKSAVRYVSGLDYNEAVQNKTIAKLQKTFNSDFHLTTGETFKDVFNNLTRATDKIKVFGVNTQTGATVNYSLFPEGLSAIIIGGYKLSRGLTLEGLSVSYFARNAKAYDTLMQMCRWFGYRENYEDVCKVYLPSESNEWYVHISNAINELYQELYNMQQQMKTPREFGLKVRSHPGSLLVTAKNRMRAAATVLVKLDLWGARQRRFKFYDDPKKNQQNIDHTSAFISSLDKCNNLIESDKALIYEDVSHDQVIDYMDSMNLVEDDVPNSVILEFIKKIRDHGVPNFKVAIKKISSTSTLKWEKESRFNDKQMLTEWQIGRHELLLPKRNFDCDKGKGVIFFPGSEVGSQGGSDEKIFLSDEEVRMITEAHEKLSAFNFINSKERDFPGLVIYLISSAVIKDYNPKNVEKITSVRIPEVPLVGYTISFPSLANVSQDDNFIEEVKDETIIQYDVTPVWRQTELFNQDSEELN